ncbi:MAG TPA: hypothetical protein VNO30_47630 [Kofleriaceae bacterium]|nr:hypothetical protein [Kofleriaceae bacterium]
MFKQFFKRGGVTEEIIYIEGVPDEHFITTLTEIAVPEKVIVGDLCPVLELRVIRGDRALYTVLEYGRDQVFDLEGDERAQLEDYMQNTLVGPIHLIPPP